MFPVRISSPGTKRIRALKLHNIMIDKEGNAKIMDFGIARMRGSAGITGEGMMIGTPDYMSPEQVDGKEADQRSDLYALGAILYEVVAGRAPFEADSTLGLALKQKTGDLFSPERKTS